jgi:hypothetical protein
MTALSLKPGVKGTDILKGETIPYSTSLRYTSKIKWNKEIFETSDSVNCPITQCQMYNLGCATPITSIIKLFVMRENGDFVLNMISN